MSASSFRDIRKCLESYEIGIERERMEWEDERGHLLKLIKVENRGRKGMAVSSYQSSFPSYPAPSFPSLACGHHY